MTDDFVLPECCDGCRYLMWEYYEDLGITGEWCDINLVFPTKKRTCKRRKPKEVKS